MMLKENWKYITVLTSCLALLITLEIIAPSPINWSSSYQHKDKIPYGTSALYSVLPDLFPTNNILTENVPLYNSLENQTFRGSNYIVINSEFDPDKLDIRELLHFVAQGNTAFIAANEFSKKFKDTLKFSTEAFSYSSMGIKKNLEQRGNLNFYNKLLKNKTDYIIQRAEYISIDSLDTTNTTVLGEMNGKIDFIKIHFGKGDFFIHVAPEAFTNFNFVNKENTDYVYKALSYLPRQQLLWDEYYKDGKEKNQNPLRFIISSPALATAYYVLIFSLLFFILIGIKRKQRIIPVITPLQNTTLDFVQIISTLYYQKGTHKDIAEKQMDYFLFYIRSNFQLSTALVDRNFIFKISNFSGIAVEKVENLFNYFSYLKNKNNINEQELLQLNSMIEAFYKTSKR